MRDINGKLRVMFITFHDFFLTKKNKKKQQYMNEPNIMSDELLIVFFFRDYKSFLSHAKKTPQAKTLLGLSDGRK